MLKTSHGARGIRNASVSFYANHFTQTLTQLLMQALSRISVQIAARFDATRQFGGGRKTASGRRWSAAGIALLAGTLLTGCAKQEVSADAPTVTVQVGAAEKETVEHKINADATLYPLDQAALVPKVAAPVKKFYVTKGSKVHAGQLLAELEGGDLAGAVTEKRGVYDQAEATYQSQLQKVEKDVQLAKEQLDQQQRLYENRESLFKQGAIAGKDVEDAKVALTQAQNQYELARKGLDVKVANAQLTAAKGQTESAQAQLSYTKITSPINGVVTDRPVYPGEMPPAGSPVITVMDLSQVIARAHVSQQEAAQLKAGTPRRSPFPVSWPELKAR